jgi:hypothetical protein
MPMAIRHGSSSSEETAPSETSPGRTWIGAATGVRPAWRAATTAATSSNDGSARPSWICTPDSASTARPGVARGTSLRFSPNDT